MRVSDRELLSRIESLARNEHEMTIEVLLHLNEVERRRLHLTLGYGTMFDFAVKHLRYSSSAAGRRIQVARCIHRHPELLEPLRRREINLSTIALVAGVLDDGNVKELIDSIRGKSQREVEHVVAAYRPAVEIRDRVQPVRVSRVADGLRRDLAATPLFSDASTPSNERDPRDRNDTQSQVSHSRCGSRTQPHATEETVASATPRPKESPAEQQFKVQFAAGAAFVRKLREARAILSSRTPGLGLEEVLEAGLDAFLNQNSPFRRKARRECSIARRSSGPPAAPRRVARGKAQQARGRAVPVAAGDARMPEGGAAQVRASNARTDDGYVRSCRSRHVPAAVRDAVFARDGGRCTYVGANGIPCGSRHQLHIDHVEPFARGGSGAIENLRLLCAPHNQLEAERVYGAEWMQRFRGGGTSLGGAGGQS
jgi:5-methylcytosine-specific restriction endonuclease McrA